MSQLKKEKDIAGILALILDKEERESFICY